MFLFSIPQVLDGIGREGSVGTDEGVGVGDRLGNNHPVKGIPMVQGQR